LVDPLGHGCQRDQPCARYSELLVLVGVADVDHHGALFAPLRKLLDVDLGDGHGATLPAAGDVSGRVRVGKTRAGVLRQIEAQPGDRPVDRPFPGLEYHSELVETAGPEPGAVEPLWSSVDDRDPCVV